MARPYRLRHNLGCVAHAAVIAIATPAWAAFDPAKVGVEAPAVAARFPDPDLPYDTPGFRPGRTDFTSHAELIAYVGALQARTRSFEVRTIGQSKEGRAIALLVFARPASVAPDALRKSAKPTVLIVAQQHGNEPAGGEAALVIARRLADGDLNPLLNRINVLIVPRANPDGGEAFVRDTAVRIDMNRDHLLLRTSEARAMALVAREYVPDVVIDAHEFTVMDRWVAKFGGVMAYDALLQYATVGNLAQALTREAEERYRTAILAALDDAHLRVHWYFTTEAGSSDRTVSMGGVQPDTWRNVGGLRNSLSFLLETRGVGIGRAHFRRRVRTHELAMEALLRTTAARPAEVLAVTRAAAAATTGSACAGDYVVESDATRTTHALTFIDPESGADRDVEVPWRSALDIRTLRTRRRPCGYLLDGGQSAVASRLRALGVVVEQVEAPTTMRAESFRVVGSDAARRVDGRGAIDDPDGVLRLTVETESLEAKVPAGTFYISLAQPLANLAAAALEPDSQNSLAANRLLPMADERTLLRAMAPPTASMHVWDGP